MPQKELLPESIIKARKAAIKKNGAKSVLSMSELNARWKKKKEHLEKIASNIRSLRYNLTRDLKSEDEKTRLTALVISVMDCSAERVGNEDSESNGHFGVTGFQKKHVKVDGNTITLKYKGKSGVEHEKSFSDPLIASAMKQAIKDSPNKFVFTTSDGFRIRADKVNRYLNQYHITAKDIRGYCANTYILSRLKKEEIIKAGPGMTEEKAQKKRKTVFNKAVRYAAEKVGHGPATLKNHYLMPEVSRDYIQYGRIINLSDFYSKGGEVKGSGNALKKPLLTVKKKACGCKHKLKKPTIVQWQKGGFIAPNGKKSNLTPQQYRLVRTPEFKKWFGDWENDPENASKVVDENGEPLVVYHGTTSQFNKFSLSHAKSQTKADWGYLGFYFTPVKSLAKEFTREEWWNEKSQFREGSKLIEVFLNLRNPNVITARSFTLFSKHPKVIRKNEINSGYDGWIINKFTKDDEDSAKRIFGEYSESLIKEFSNNQYVAFFPNQIKLADGTNTTFNSNNPDIRFKEGGEVEKSEVEKQIDNYLKQGIFIGKGDKVYTGTVNMERFTGKDRNIFPSQLYVDKSGVRKWKKRIKNGEKPAILVGFRPIDDRFYIIDGHHKLTAYDQLGITEIPVIDKTGKLVMQNKEANIEEQNETSEDHYFDNSGKHGNFTENITNEEIRNIISGKSEVSNGDTIQAALNFLRSGQSAGTQAKEPREYKQQEAERLKSYITENNLWIPSSYFEHFLDEGAEQQVYFSAPEYVIKTNNTVFYNSWKDYFISLLLHNYFFPDTAYELIGFTERQGELLSVVKQPFVESNEKTDLRDVREFMLGNGFINNKNNDYYNPESGIIIEDLHEENVLTQDGILQFVDTVFYVSPDTIFGKGGKTDTSRIKQKLSVIYNQLKSELSRRI